MSFWATSQGEVLDGGEKEFDGGGGQLETIPNDTKCLAMVEKAGWAKTQDGMSEYINLQWTVLKPDNYLNRKVFQKLWVTDLEPRVLKDKGKEKAIEKRDKAKRMLAAIDANCGGKLVKVDGKPSDAQLTACLTNTPMLISVMEWVQQNSTTGEEMRGNWIRAVASKGSAEIPDKAPPAAPKKAASSPRGNIGSGFTREMDDDIPF